MLLYVGRRVLWTLPTLLLVGLLVFVLMRLVPGDPALLILGDSATYSNKVGDMRQGVRIATPHRRGRPSGQLL